jgi:hypothetical protein
MLKRSTKTSKPKREPWIKPRKRVDLSKMTACFEARIRAGRLSLMGCAACGKVPAQIHHIRDGHGLSERAPWWETIPLCNEHHNGSQFSTHGACRREFHHAHGTEREMLERVDAKLPVELRGPVAVAV